MRRPIVSLLLVAALLALSSCAPELPQDPRQEVVHARFDPTQSLLPTPTDLVRDPTTGYLNLPLAPDLPDAELHFRAYLNSLDGYPTQSTLTIPVSGPVNLSTLPASLLLLDQESNQAIELDVRYDEEASALKAKPSHRSEADRLLPGKAYTLSLRGYSGGAKGQDGELLVADPAFAYIRSTNDLRDHLEAMPGDNKDEQLAAAEQLTTLQQAFAPLFKQAVARGTPRDEIAVLSSFHTSSAPTVYFDPDAGEVPMPNDLLRSADGSTVELPIDPEASDEIKHILERLNHYEGFSTTGAITFKTTAPIDPESAKLNQSIHLLRILDGQITPVPADDLEQGILSDGQTLWIRPKLALEHNAQYAAVLSRDLRDDQGRNFEPQPLSVLLRNPAPLISDGESQVSIIDDATAAQLEPVRATMAPALEYLEGQGTNRLKIAAAVTFRTTPSIEWLHELRAELYRNNTNTQITEIVNETPFDRGLLLAMPLVKTVITGKMTVRDYLDPNTRAFQQPMQAQDRQVDFVLTIPLGFNSREPIPVVLFGHGLMTSRELVYMIANRMARAGFATFSLDLPYHGKRSVCDLDEQCLGDATCAEDGSCRNADGSKSEVNRIQSPWPDGPSYPSTTGLAFIDMSDIFAVRDHFAQALIDLCQGLRVIRHADWEKQIDYTLDGDDVVYLGMSLGGILGSVMTVLEPTIGTFALNVPGGDFLRLIENSSAFRDTFQSAIDHRGVEKGTDEYFRFTNILRWIMDPIDPINIAHHAVGEPVSYVDPLDMQTKMTPTKRVIIQMADNDLVVPNESTHALSERMNVPITTYTPLISNHGFLFDPTSNEGSKARDQIVRHFDGR